MGISCIFGKQHLAESKSQDAYPVPALATRGGTVQHDVFANQRRSVVHAQVASVVDNERRLMKHATTDSGAVMHASRAVSAASLFVSFGSGLERRIRTNLKRAGQGDESLAVTSAALC